MRWKLVVAVGLLALVLVFALQNFQVVEIRFLFWKLEVSRALLLFLVFGAGGVLGWLVRGSARP